MCRCQIIRDTRFGRTKRGGVDGSTGVSNLPGDVKGWGIKKKIQKKQPRIDEMFTSAR